MNQQNIYNDPAQHLTCKTSLAAAGEYLCRLLFAPRHHSLPQPHIITHMWFNVPQSASSRSPPASTSNSYLTDYWFYFILQDDENIRKQQYRRLIICEYIKYNNIHKHFLQLRVPYSTYSYIIFSLLYTFRSTESKCW